MDKTTIRVLGVCLGFYLAYKEDKRRVALQKEPKKIIIEIRA